MLPATDLEYLRERIPGYSVTPEAGLLCVLMPQFELGEGFSLARSDLLIRLAPGYPDVLPDMWWFSPPIQRSDGKAIACTQVREHHLQRDWQRWSRHLTPAQWKSGIDGLESYVAIIRRELRIASTASTS
jgi:hypothetical protein